MVNVAIAGGTSSIGRTIVEAIISAGTHNVVVLSRESSSTVFAAHPEVKILAVDYTSVDNIASVLKENAIHTVISTLSPQAAEGELNLIDGAVKAGTVRRFAPSEFGVDYLECKKRGYPFPAMDFKNATTAKLRSLSPSLTYTRFVCGTFMDYLGPPTAPSHLKIANLVIDVSNNFAAIPGSGSTPFVITHSTDVANFVAAALDFDKWDEMSLMVGDRLSWNDIVAIAEEVKGQKFTVAHDSITDLQAGKNTELPCNVPRYAYVPKQMIDTIHQVIGQAIDCGLINIQAERTLNEALPSIKPMSFRDFVEKYANA